MKMLNIANVLTIFRIVLVPFFVAFIMLDNLLLSVIIFAVACLTDLLDGQLARRMNLITEFGKFLDPLADKILTVSALICFVELEWTYAWVVIVIITREFIVSGMRMTAAGRKDKVVIAADLAGKIKTAFTMVAIAAVLIIQMLFPHEDLTRLITDILMYCSAVLTLWSGASYVWNYRFIFGDDA